MNGTDNLSLDNFSIKPEVKCILNITVDIEKNKR